ncbi:RIMS3 protein, partial [Prunella fulvescens]|nr:RIMS3 protein [Prunella fulvescens]
EGGPKKLRSTIRRSTETGIAVEMRTRVTRQGSRESTDGSTNSNSSDGTFIFPTTRLGAESQFSDFLDGLGPGQLVGRQTLATPPMGEQGQRPGGLRSEGRGEEAACIPSCIPQTFPSPTTAGFFHLGTISPELPAPSPLPCPQVIVWGDYGRMDHKCFMGMAQIILEELDLSSAVSGWYKLFPTSSLADSSIGPLTRRLSQSSLESSTSPSCP